MNNDFSRVHSKHIISLEYPFSYASTLNTPAAFAVLAKQIFNDREIFCLMRFTCTLHYDVASHTQLSINVPKTARQCNNCAAAAVYGKLSDILMVSE
jgi:hypothetical protein